MLARGSEVGLGCGIGSVLASLVAALTFISAKVIVPCVLVATAFAAAGVEDTFLEGTGELTDDLREAAGLPSEVFLLRGHSHVTSKKVVDLRSPSTAAHP